MLVISNHVYFTFTPCLATVSAVQQQYQQFSYSSSAHLPLFAIGHGLNTGLLLEYLIKYQ